MAEGVEKTEAMVRGRRIGDRRIAPVVELPRVGHDAPEARAVAPEKLGGRVDDNRGAPVDRSAQIRGAKVLSTMSGNRCVGEADSRARSRMLPEGLPTVSPYRALVFLVMACSQLSMRVGSTK